MLIKNNLDKIVSVRSSGGEEVIGRLTEETADTITLAKPIMVHLQMTPQGAAISFAPFCLARDEDADCTFYRSSLLLVPAPVRDDIRANYIKATTGLDIPTGGGIIMP